MTMVPDKILLEDIKYTRSDLIPAMVAEAVDEMLTKVYGKWLVYNLNWGDFETFSETWRRP